MHDACVRRVREGVGDAVTYKAAERTAAHATTEEVPNGKLFREASRERERVCEDVQAYALYDVRACERCAQCTRTRVRSLHLLLPLLFLRSINDQAGFE